MTLKPVVKVWKSPPTEKMNAPANNVFRRPKMSPTRPEIREVTASDTCQKKPIGGSSKDSLTESSNLENRDLCAVSLSLHRLATIL